MRAYVCVCACLHAGAARLSMPPVPEQQFVGAVKDMVKANSDFVSGAGWQVDSATGSVAVVGTVEGVLEV